MPPQALPPFADGLSMFFVAVAVVAVAVVACVGLHLGTLVTMARTLDRWFSHAHWRAMGCLVLLAITAHLFEMAIFAFGIRLLEYLHDGVLHTVGIGFDAWYRSAVAYTSLGDESETLPAVRMLVAVEALTGLILIAWTASFLFVVMQRTWESTRTPSGHRKK